jgi:hypothetical protein
VNTKLGVGLVNEDAASYRSISAASISLSAIYMHADTSLVAVPQASAIILLSIVHVFYEQSYYVPSPYYS